MRVGAIGGEEAPSRVADMGGPGRVGLRENPRGVGPREGSRGRAHAAPSWVTYVCSAGRTGLFLFRAFQVTLRASSLSTGAEVRDLSLGVLGRPKVGKKLEGGFRAGHKG